MLLAWGVVTTPLARFSEINPVWQPLFDFFISIPGLLALTLFSFLFPDGRFRSRPAAWLAGGLMLVFLVGHILPGTVLDYRRWPPFLAFLFFLTWIGSMVGGQIQRYRQSPDPVHGQQTKWVIFGISAALSGDFFFFRSPVPSLHIQPSLTNNLIINAG
jgi:hypothetical protein